MKVEESKYGNIRFLNRVSRTLLNNKSLSHDIYFFNFRSKMENTPEVLDTSVPLQHSSKFPASVPKK